MRAEGWFQSILTKPDGRQIVQPWKKNQIQNAFAEALAGLCLGYDFGQGTGLGINYMAFGEGDPTWWTHDATFGTVVSGKSEPYTIVKDSGITFKFDDDVAKIVTMETTDPADPPSSTLNLDGAGGLLEGFNAMLTPHGVAYNLAGKLAVRTVTPGAAGSVEVVPQPTLIEMADSSFLDLPFGINYGIDAGYGFSASLDKDDTTLENEFARQAILSTEFTFINPTTYVTSLVPTNMIRFTVVRGPTAAAETHGEFGLYVGASGTSGSGKMVNWAIRASRIPKGPLDTLTTVCRIKFLQA